MKHAALLALAAGVLAFLWLLEEGPPSWGHQLRATLMACNPDPRDVPGVLVEQVQTLELRPPDCEPRWVTAWEVD